MSQPSSSDSMIANEGDEFLTRVVIDPSMCKFYLYSNEGDSKVVDCDNTEEFMSVLELVKAIAPEDCIAYAEPKSSPNFTF